MSDIQTEDNAPDRGDFLNRIQGAIAHALSSSGTFSSEQGGETTQEVYQDLPETNDVSQIQDVFFPCCFLELTEIENDRSSRLGLFKTNLELNILIILGEYQRTDFTQRSEAKKEARKLLSWMTNWFWTLDDTRSDLPNLLQFRKDGQGRFVDENGIAQDEYESYVPKNLLYFDVPTPSNRFCLEYYNTFETVLASSGSIRVYMGDEGDNEPYNYRNAYNRTIINISAELALQLEYDRSLQGGPYNP